MTYEFQCEDGFVVTRFFKTIGGAIAHFDANIDGDTYDHVADPRDPSKRATRYYGNSGTQFYGEGWDNPAPSGKQYTTGVDAAKAMSSMGRPSNRSFLGNKG